MSSIFAKTFSLHQLADLLFEPFDDALFQAGDIALRNAQLICNVLLRHLLAARKPEAKVHDAALAFGKVRQRLFQQFLLDAALDAPVHGVAIRPQNVRKKQFVSLEVGVERLVKGNFALEFRCPPQIHQDLVLDAARGIRRELDVLVRAKGIDCLDEPDGADGDQIVLIDARILKFVRYVDDEPQIVLDELRFDLFCLLARFQAAQHLCLLFPRIGQGERLTPA